MTYAEQHKAAIDQMYAVWATKPRSLKKLYGTNGPTPEQLEAWHAAYNAWSKEYRAVCRKVARLLPLANAEYRESTYATTLGELRDVIEDAIKWYGEDTPYVLVGCYSAEGLVEKEYLREDEGQRRIRLFTDLCSG